MVFNCKYQVPAAEERRTKRPRFLHVSNQYWSDAAQQGLPASSRYEFFNNLIENTMGAYEGLYWLRLERLESIEYYS